VGPLNSSTKKTIILLSFIVLLVVGLWAIKGWADEAYLKSEDAITKKDSDHWYEVYETRISYAGYLIVGATIAFALVFAAGVFDEDEDEEKLREELLAEEAGERSEAIGDMAEERPVERPVAAE